MHQDLDEHYGKIMSDFRKNEDLISDSSRLCLSCGICCQGVMYDHAGLQADEVDLYYELGFLPFMTTRGKEGFRLPCIFYIDNKCSIYSIRRPKICASYKCKLLRNLMDREIDSKEREQIVTETKRLIESIQDRLTTKNASMNFQQKIETSLNLSQIELLSADNSTKAILMDLATLEILLKKHFFLEAELRKLDHNYR